MPSSGRRPLSCRWQHRHNAAAGGGECTAIESGRPLRWARRSGDRRGGRRRYRRRVFRTPFAPIPAMVPDVHAVPYGHQKVRELPHFDVGRVVNEGPAIDRVLRVKYVRHGRVVHDDRLPQLPGKKTWNGQREDAHQTHAHTRGPLWLTKRGVRGSGLEAICERRHTYRSSRSRSLT